MDDAVRLGRLALFLESALPKSILVRHPNDLGDVDQFVVPDEWSAWWDWAARPPARNRAKWLTLLDYYQRPSDDRIDYAYDDIPTNLRNTIDAVRELQLPRRLDDWSSSSSQCTSHSAPQPLDGTVSTLLVNYPGMSPKKAHEVGRMTSYTSSLLSSEGMSRITHVVDVGAGQGHLSRALQSLGLHVLALDASAHQTAGAEKWQKGRRTLNKNGKAQLPAVVNAEPSPSGTITRKTVHITPETLISAVDEWANSVSTEGEPPSVLFMGLHACGSLTPDILRALLASSDSSRQDWPRPWKAAGAVVVGCCYNLMSPSDFPLSNILRKQGAPGLGPNHLQLAVQVPQHWAGAELSMRRVVWRALLVREMIRRGISSAPVHSSSPTPTSEAQTTAPKRSLGGAPILRDDAQPESSRGLKYGGAEVPGWRDGDINGRRRLGKLHETAYASWETYLRAAGEKMGVDLTRPVDDETEVGEKDEVKERVALERRLEVFQVLRCVLGPAIESTIILDRLMWLRESLDASPSSGSSDIGRPRLQARRVNLFDQATGSGRNVALVLSPVLAPV